MAEKKMSQDQQNLQLSVDELQALNKEASKIANTISRYDAQLQENEVVKKELELIEPEGRVFKLMGPALVPQELEEANSNVDKRIGFITDELKRYQMQIDEVAKKQETAKEKCIDLQKKVQSTQAAAAKK